MSKINNGIDAIAMQGGYPGTISTAMTGTSTTAPTATTFPMDGATMPSASTGGPPQNVGALIGSVVCRANRYGIILQHSATAATGATIDQWYDPTTGLQGSTPAAGQWMIAPGNAHAIQMGLSTATATINATDTCLGGTSVSEIWNSGGGLNRGVCVFGHTRGTPSASYTLTKVFTSTGSDPASSTVHRVGIFQHAVNAAPSTTTTGIMIYVTNLSADAIITNNGTDSLTVTETVTIS